MDLDALRRLATPSTHPPFPTWDALAAEVATFAGANLAATAASRDWLNRAEYLVLPAPDVGALGMVALPLSVVASVEDPWF